MQKYVVFVVFIALEFVLGRNDFTIKFIKSYIENENKPTHLIHTGLCWNKMSQVKMVKELSKSGIRCSSSKFFRSKYKDQDILFLADLECADSVAVLLNASLEKQFQFPFRWLILSSSLINASNTILWECPVLRDSDLVLAENIDDKQIKQFLLTEVYKPSVIEAMLITPRGFYNGSLVDTRQHRQLYQRRKNLMGHPLIMANVIQDSNDTKEHLLKEDRLNLQYDAATKLCWICAKHAFEMLNATPQYIWSYRWGYKVNGQWSGMINDINSNKADLGTECVLYAERLDVVTYTDVVAPLHMRFIFRQPPLAYVSNIFSLPFSTDVWVALVVCVVASTITLYLTSKWETRLETSASQLDGSMGDALLLTLSAVAQQGCFIEPRRAPGRIMEWVLFTALMALYAAYSANIVVLLQAPSNSVRSLAHLAASKITLAANDVDYSRFVFKGYKDPTHIQIFKRVIPDNGNPEFYDIYDGVEKIRQGLFAFHSIVEPVYRRIEQTFLETEKCDLTEIDFVNGFDAFTPVKKDSPFLELIRVVYKRIRESGIQSALIKRFQVPKPKCSSNAASFSSVGLLDMRPVLLFMLYGIALSLLILLVEILYHRLYQKCINRKKPERHNHAKL